jgi:hypothetical protein
VASGRFAVPGPWNTGGNAASEENAAKARHGNAGNELRSAAGKTHKPARQRRRRWLLALRPEMWRTAGQPVDLRRPQQTYFWRDRLVAMGDGHVRDLGNHMRSGPMAGRSLLSRPSRPPTGSSLSAPPTRQHSTHHRHSSLLRRDAHRVLRRQLTSPADLAASPVLAVLVPARDHRRTPHHQGRGSTSSPSAVELATSLGVEPTASARGVCVFSPLRPAIITASGCSAPDPRFLQTPSLRSSA